MKKKVTEEGYRILNTFGIHFEVALQITDSPHWRQLHLISHLLHPSRFDLDCAYLSTIKMLILSSTNEASKNK